MSITNQLDQYLTTDGVSPISIITSRGVAHLDVAAVEQFACRLNSIRFTTAANSGAAVDWNQVADSIVKRVRYLAEPLEVIERDRVSETAQIRSNPPTVEAKTTSYFECLASPGRIEVRRFVRSGRDDREAVAFSMTRESLAQLLLDLNAACESQPAEPNTQRHGRVRIPAES